MTTIWVCEIDTSNFTFSSYGSSPHEARRAMWDGLKKHARQYKLQFKDFCQYLEITKMDDLVVSPRLMGAAYRDRQPL